MKRKPLLIITLCEEKRFEVLQRRLQLPFDTTGGQWRDYSLQDAFLLRVFLELITRESLEKDDTLPGEIGKSLGKIDGFSPTIELAQYILSELRAKSIWEVLREKEPFFIGAAAFKEQTKSGEPYFRLARFMGGMNSFPSWVGNEISGGAESETLISLHKVLLVDVADPARLVLQNAKAMALEEAVSPSVVIDGRATE